MIYTTRAADALQPSAVRYDFDGYGYLGYQDEGSGSNWQSAKVQKQGSEYLYTKEDIIDFLKIMRLDHLEDADILQESGEEHYKYYQNVAYGLNQIIKDLECMQK